MFGGIFDDSIQIRLWGYNIETVMAEKAETILSRGVFNTRPRDFYDVYIFETTRKFDQPLFEQALAATAAHRGSTESIADRKGIIGQITKSSTLRDMWKKYQHRFRYASGIAYEDIIKALQKLLL